MHPNSLHDWAWKRIGCYQSIEIRIAHFIHISKIFPKKVELEMEGATVWTIRKQE